MTKSTKNLKINKKALVVASGFILTQAIYFGCYVDKTEKNPFVNNKYKASRLDVKEYSKEGKAEITTYVTKPMDKKSSLVLKMPYYEIDDNMYEREVLFIPDDQMSNVEKEYTIQNIDDQTLLMSQDYIGDIIKKSDNGSNFELFRYEEAKDVLEQDKYEITFVEFNQDSKDIKYIKSKKEDFKNRFRYFTGAIALGGGEGVLLYLNNKRKKKVKVK